MSKKAQDADKEEAPTQCCSWRPSLGICLVSAGLAFVVGILALLLFQSLSQSVPQSISKNIRNVFRSAGGESAAQNSAPQDFSVLWFSDFKGNRVVGINRSKQIVWEQSMVSPPIPLKSYNTHTEYVTVAPSGNIIVVDGEGMMVQELDRATHNLLWQYGVKDIQGYVKGFLHQPDKSYKLNDHEVVINDGNNRRIIIVDQRTGEVIWQYGETLKMGSQSGLLRGNTNVVPIGGESQFIITDTLEKKILIVDRATRSITWQWSKPDAKWLQHVWPTKEGTFVLEDRQANEVFEVNREGTILWTLSELSDGSTLRYPADVIKLDTGTILIAEAGRGRIIEVSLGTKEIVWEYNGAGFVTTIAVEYDS